MTEGRRRRELTGLRGLVAAGLLLGVGGAAVLCAIVLWSALSGPDAPPAASARPVRVVSTSGLLFPLEGAVVTRIADSFDAPRSGGRTHRAIDLLAARGTPVRAVTDGRIIRLSRAGAGGLAVYQADAEGKRGYYYAHLDRIADGMLEGREVRRGEVIGFVGSTGNAPPGTPHLHFAAWEITDARSPWTGRALNPYEFWRVEYEAGATGASN